MPDVNAVCQLTASEYRSHVHALHAKLAGGEATDYVESKIALPRSLQGLRSGQVMLKVLALNPSLHDDDWSTVMAEVVGNNLILGTVTTAGRTLINNLNGLKLEPGGRTVTVPQAAKPNNMYYVECLLPYERELHVEFLAAFLKNFPTAKHISMPGKKAFGTTRRIRLYFHSTTAPREVFTPDNASIPIREILLPCGSAAQVIHKWQRLNQTRPPHLLNRWAQNGPPRSYAAAISGFNNTPPISLPRPTYAQTAANNDTPANPLARATTNPSTPTSSLQINTHQQTPVPPATRPGEVQRPNTARNDLPEQLTHHHAPHIPAPPATPSIEWDTNEPFPQPTARATPASDPDTTAERQHLPQPEPPRNNSHPINQRSPQEPQPRTSVATNPPTPTAQVDQHTPQHHVDLDPPAIQGSHVMPPSAQSSHAHNTHNTPAATQDQPSTSKTSPAHPAPSRSDTDINQWQQVKRQRTRKATGQSAPAEGMEKPPLSKSGSRSRKVKPTNKFSALDFIILPTFSDDDVTPIEVALPSKPSKPPRRKFKDSRRSITSQARDAIAHQKALRHPAHTLAHFSPTQTQVLLRSPKDEAKRGRDRLIRQIALLRAVRANHSRRNILLDQVTDDLFMDQLRVRLSECHDPPECKESTPIDLPLSAVLDQDESRVRGAVCYAWVDLATRAVLPHLYDLWPEPPIWKGSPLKWLPANDAEVPCLQDESLAALAACPSLSTVWQHLSTPATDLSAALQSAANQWHLFTTSQKRN